MAMDYELFAKAVVRTIKKAIAPRDQKINELKSQVGELRAKVFQLEGKALPTYSGKHERGTKYIPGSLVTKAGGLWLATAETDETPGHGPTRWLLVVKRGGA
jgi:hypothetical protein